jgi:predicted nucleic acid-binding protein
VGLLIDSTVFVTAERRAETAEAVVAGLLEAYGDVDLALSVMSAGELVHGCWRADPAARRARRAEVVEAILAAIPVVPLTLAIARLCGELDARSLDTCRGAPIESAAIHPVGQEDPRCDVSPPSPSSPPCSRSSPPRPRRNPKRSSSG